MVAFVQSGKIASPRPTMVFLVRRPGVVLSCWLLIINPSLPSSLRGCGGAVASPAAAKQSPPVLGDLTAPSLGAATSRRGGAWISSSHTERSSLASAVAGTRKTSLVDDGVVSAGGGVDDDDGSGGDGHRHPRRRPNLDNDDNDNNQNKKLKGPKEQPPRPTGNTYWVVPGKLLAGEYPGDKRGDEATRRKLRSYLNMGVNYFLDLTHRGEREDYEAVLLEIVSSMTSSSSPGSVTYKRIPIQDFGVPSRDQMASILDAIDEAIGDQTGSNNNNTVYVHCRGGIGRTGTAAGCYLVRHGNTGEEALAEVNRLFRNSGRSAESFVSPETPAQMRFVREWKEGWGRL